MAARDYLGLAFPGDAGTVTGDKIPEASVLRTRRHVLIGISADLDLIRYTDAQRAIAGGAPSPDEIELNSLFVRFISKQAALLKELGRDPDLLADTVRMDGALQQAQGAVAEVVDLTREACIVLASELTTGNDRCEEAAAQLQADPATTEAQRLVLKARFAAVHNLRDDVQKAQDDRLGRDRLRTARQAAQLQAAHEPGQRLLQSEALRNAPLPVAAKTK